MALTALWTRDVALERLCREALDPRWHDLLPVRDADAARRMVRERPVAALLVDARSLPPERMPLWVAGTSRRFPSVALAVVGSGSDPALLHELGRAGLRHLVLLDAGAEAHLRRALRRVLADTVVGPVSRRLSPLLPRTHLDRLRAALEWTHRRPGADAFAEALGMSRPHLGRLLAEGGLPPAGHLLLWARLLHAGFWLPDPGRSGESVGRQLEYANGSTFRRALRSFVDATPGEVARDGGVGRVLDAFVASAGLDRSGAAARRVA